MVMCVMINKDIISIISNIYSTCNMWNLNAVDLDVITYILGTWETV